MEEDIDEVLLRLPNQSVMQDKSNAKFSLGPTNQILDTESESDDCLTSVSRCPVNPLSVLEAPSTNTLSLPTVKMITYDRFWQERDQNEENDITEDVTEPSSSVGTFSGKSKEKRAVIFSEWCPVLNNKELHIGGVTVNGTVDTRIIDRRISGFIFYDKSEVPCSLGGPLTLLHFLPRFIQRKFNMGIPEDWVQVRSLWIKFQKLGSPENFAWLSSTDLDTETSDVHVNRTGYNQSVRTGTKLAISTPRNNTNDFCNMTTEISKIDATDGFRHDRQKSFKHTVKSVAGRSMKKTYTSAELKRKMRKIQSMLKVTLMRERPTVRSFEELPELQGNESELSAYNIDVPVDKIVPQPTTIASDNKNEHLLQNKLQQHSVIQNRSKNDINMSETSQSEDIKLSRSKHTLPNEIGSNINNVDSLKTSSNVFLNKSQFVTKNKSNNYVNNHSSSSKNSAIIKTHVAYKNETSANLSPKIRENISPRAISSETSEMSKFVSNQSQSSKSNSCNKNKLKHPSVVSKLSVNTSEKIMSPTTSSEELRIVSAKIFAKHRDSLTLLMEKKSGKSASSKSVSSNSSVIDDLDSYPSNVNSVVISYHNSNLISDTSDIPASQTAKNISQSSKNTEKTSSEKDSSINKVVQPEENHSESSSEDNIFPRHPPLNVSSDNDSFFFFKSKKSQIKRKQNVLMSDSEHSDNEDLKVIRNQNSNQINKIATENVEILNSVINQSDEDSQIENIILSSSESSGDNNVDIPNAYKKLKQILEKKINSLNPETSDGEGVIQVNKISESSNKKNSFLSESSDSEEIEDCHVTVTTNAIVHSMVNLSVRNGQVPVQKNTSINKSGSKKNRNNAKKDTVQKAMSNTSSNLTTDSDVNLNNTTFSGRGRVRCARLPFWKGTRLVTNGDVTIITNTSAQNSPYKTVEKRVLTPEKQTSVAKRTGTKIPQTSHVKILNTEPNSSSSSSSSSSVLEQHKNIPNVQAETPKNSQIPQKQIRSSSENKIEKSPVKTTKKLNTAVSSGSCEDFVDDVQEKPEIKRRLRSTSKKQTKYPIENSNDLIYISSSDMDSKIQTIGLSRTAIDSENLSNKNIAHKSKSARRLETENPQEIENDGFNRVRYLESIIAELTANFNDDTSPTDSPEEVIIDKKFKKLNDKTQSANKLESKLIRLNENVKYSLKNKFEENSTNTLDQDTNISFVHENGEYKLSPSKSYKSKDIHQNSPLQNGNNSELDTNIQILDNVNFASGKSQLNKKFKSSLEDSQEIVDSCVESNNKNKQIECESTSTDKHNAQIKNKTILPIAARITEKDNDKSGVEISKRNIRKIYENHDDQSMSSKKRNSKTKTENYKTQSGNIENTILNKNHSVDTSTSNFTKPAVKRGSMKKTKDEVKKKQTNTRTARLHNSVSHTNSSVMSFNDTASNVSSLNTTISSRGRTCIPTLPFWKGSRVISVNNELEIISNASDSINISSVKPKTKKRKSSKNRTNDKNLTSGDTDTISARLKRRKNLKYSQGEIYVISSESDTPESSKKTSTKTVAKCYDEYINNKCTVVITPLSVEEIKKYTEKKSTERQVQRTMNDKQCKPVNETVNNNKPRTAEKSTGSASVVKAGASSTKKPRKRKSLMDMYFGDPVKMPLLIKLKRKRISKEEQLVNTTNLSLNTASSIFVNQKTGKRKLFNEEEWLNSKECRDSVGAIDNEPRRSQTFRIQVEQNIVQQDDFDDDVISEVSAFAKTA